MYVRLNHYINKPKIIHDSEHGFQPGQSPSIALPDTDDRILTAIGNSEEYS